MQCHPNQKNHQVWIDSPWEPIQVPIPIGALLSHEVSIVTVDIVNKDIKFQQPPLNDYHILISADLKFDPWNALDIRLQYAKSPHRSLFIERQPTDKDQYLSDDLLNALDYIILTRPSAYGQNGWSALYHRLFASKQINWETFDRIISEIFAKGPQYRSVVLKNPRKQDNVVDTIVDNKIFYYTDPVLDFPLTTRVYAVASPPVQFLLSLLEHLPRDLCLCTWSFLHHGDCTLCQNS